MTQRGNLLIPFRTSTPLKDGCCIDWCEANCGTTQLLGKQFNPKGKEFWHSSIDANFELREEGLTHQSPLTEESIAAHSKASIQGSHRTPN